MNTLAISWSKKTGVGEALTKPALWIVFILYVAILGYIGAHHELWVDELHNWNVAKESGSFFDLIANRRYEGHPPVWYIIAWSVSKFSHNVVYLQVVQWIISCLLVFMILFFSPFPLVTRIFILLGYYFLFEYTAFSRNYAIGLLLACGICSIIQKDFKYKLFLYYALLFCMSNTHLLALALAGSFHLYFLLLNIERKKSIRIIILHALAGVLILLPAVYFIFPPSDSELTKHFWTYRWTIRQMADAADTPLRAFIPVPAWWKYDFWNTQFLLEAKNNYKWLKFITPFISISLVALVFFILRKNKKCVALFAANLLLVVIISVAVYPLVCARYAGFIYVGFIAAYWLYCYETPIAESRKRLVNMLLATQVLAGVFAVSREILFPFSNLYRVNELVRAVPANERLVTDFWTLDTMIAFTDRPAYCVDMQKEMSFIMWARDLSFIQYKPYRYSEGIRVLFQKEGLRRTWMISAGSPQSLFAADTQLAKSFRIMLVDKREGAIDKGSNLYLYQINSF